MSSSRQLASIARLRRSGRCAHTRYSAHSLAFILFFGDLYVNTHLRAPQFRLPLRSFFGSSSLASGLLLFLIYCVHPHLDKTQFRKASLSVENPFASQHRPLAVPPEDPPPPRLPSFTWMTHASRAERFRRKCKLSARSPGFRQTFLLREANVRKLFFLSSTFFSRSFTVKAVLVPRIALLAHAASRLPSKNGCPATTAPAQCRRKTLRCGPRSSRWFAAQVYSRTFGLLSLRPSIYPRNRSSHGLRTAIFA